MFDGIIFCFGVNIRPDAIKAMRALKVKPRSHKLLHTLLEDIKQLCIDKTRQE
jgi:translation initiation factor IF-2